VILTSDDPRWSDSWQVLAAPRAGGSLADLFLEAAASNGFPSGEMIRASRRKGTGPGRYASPGLLLAGTVLDLERIARMVGTDLRAIDALTIRPLVRSLYGDLGHTNGQGAASRFRLCGGCCALRDVPLLHLLDNVRACVRHDRALAETCGCGAPLLPFADQDPPWTCHLCGGSYAALDAAPPRDLDTEQARAAVYTALFGMEERSALPIGAALGRVLRRRLRGRDTPFLDSQLHAAGHRPSWWLISEAMVALGSPISDLLAEAADEARQPRRAGAVRLAGCPSVGCTGRVARASTRPTATEPDYVCRRCGVRFAPGRVTFAFDPQPGYPEARVRTNRRLLEALRGQVAAAADRRRRTGEPLTVEAVFREAGVPTSQSYRTPRAGLVEIVSAAAVGQLAADLTGELFAS
jgi:hypothetical protein